ncbi:hypothetical protein [Mycobacteroides chelonae]|uniref:hypothetical protein n=1 Tax=Mycobacteroides chelonae TaxID=1774 RepID=UPI0008A89C5D|nr:hypothetical protein [Mycobacteroides chelonae]OHU12827.1 hypothetical protein BKG75_17600 [Mycobacteroides chelonae]
MANEMSSGEPTHETVGGYSFEGGGYWSLFDLKGDTGFSGELGIPARQLSVLAVMVGASVMKTAAEKRPEAIISS